MTSSCLCCLETTLFVEWVEEFSRITLSTLSMCIPLEEVVGKKVRTI
jgi:hypothetical protein